MSECKTCPGGWYCEHYGASEPTGQCDPGYYCEYGMDRARPTGMDNITDVSGTCVLPGEISEYFFLHKSIHFHQLYFILRFQLDM